MPKVSVNILTKNRAGLLRKALQSIRAQSFKDYEVVLIDDGSTDNTKEVEKEMADAGLSINFVIHNQSLGITLSREEALEKSQGEYIAILDDDDEWIKIDKLAKQVKFLDDHKDCVLVGGGIKLAGSGKREVIKFRPETDLQIRKTMLLRNNFFTSTVMFRKASAILAGGFIKDSDDFAEDYDLWLRLGKLGSMYNFQEPFALYNPSNYNKARKKAFLAKQLRLVTREKANYPYYLLSAALLKLRLL